MAPGSARAPARPASLGTTLAPFLGVLLSLYALHVEHHKRQDPSFSALCDLPAAKTSLPFEISCSDVFTSQFGHAFSHLGLVSPGSALDVPNAAAGVLFYIFVLVLSLAPVPARLVPLASAALLAGALVSEVFSVYLAYVLLFVLHELCIVCVTSYVLNTWVLLAAVSRLRSPQAAAQPAIKHKRR